MSHLVCILNKLTGACYWLQPQVCKHTHMHTSLDFIGTAQVFWGYTALLRTGGGKRTLVSFTSINCTAFPWRLAQFKSSMSAEHCKETCCFILTTSYHNREVGGGGMNKRFSLYEQKATSGWSVNPSHITQENSLHLMSRTFSTSVPLFIHNWDVALWTAKGSSLSEWDSSFPQSAGTNLPGQRPTLYWSCPFQHSCLLSGPWLLLTRTIHRPRLCSLQTWSWCLCKTQPSFKMDCTRLGPSFI